MVDFTKPINNGDMVKGLNELIRSNTDLVVFYDQELCLFVKGENDLRHIKTLKNLHEQHAHMLGDTVRLLGGAPDFKRARHSWIRRVKNWFGSVRHGSNVWGW